MSENAHLDDYSLTRVPASARYPWLSVAIQRFGQVSSLSQFLLGATLGFGMSFWGAFWALTFGAVILEIVSIFVGIIGMREGLSTSLVARWLGFGRSGSALMGLFIGLSAVCWFGIQSAVSAEGLHGVLGGPPTEVWAILFGLMVTGIVVFGFSSMAWTAYLTVPPFLILVAWSTITALSEHRLTDLMQSPPPGPSLSLAAGTTVVAGSFIVGAVITPDMTRFNRSAKDVVKQTLLGMTLGEYVIGMVGVLLAHGMRSDNVITIVTSSVGWVGVLIIVLATLKINDWNLYSSGLATVNFIGVIFRRDASRAVVTVVLGVAGTLLAAAGILGSFVEFLTVLGVAVPPIAGIMVAEYFVVRNWRAELDEGRETGAPPSSAPNWVPATLVIWALAFAVGQFVDWGLGSVNALVVAFVGYVVAGKLGLVRGVGRSRTESVPGGSTPEPRPGVAIVQDGRQ
jgi:cytosine permease